MWWCPQSAPALWLQIEQEEFGSATHNGRMARCGHLSVPALCRPLHTLSRATSTRVRWGGHRSSPLVKKEMEAQRDEASSQGHTAPRARQGLSHEGRGFPTRVPCGLLHHKMETGGRAKESGIIVTGVSCCCSNGHRLGGIKQHTCISVLELKSRCPWAALLVVAQGRTGLVLPAPRGCLCSWAPALPPSPEPAGPHLPISLSLTPVSLATCPSLSDPLPPSCRDL